MATPASPDITVCYRGLLVESSAPPPVAICLEEAGCRVTLIGDDASLLPDRGCLLIWGSAAWYPRVRRRLLAMPPMERPLIVIWHSEPLPAPDASGLRWQRPSLREVAKMVLRPARATDMYTSYFLLRRLAKQGLPDILVVSGRGRQDFLAERGIRAHIAPLGYTADMGHDLGLSRDIDVLFLGAPDIARRRALLATFERQGVRITRAGSWTDPASWGEPRTRLLNRTKILLNLARTPGELSGYRLLLGMANKALVVSEPLYAPYPYVPGTHFVMATIDEIPERIQYYLTHHDERRQITDAAYAWARQELTLQRSVSRVLDLIAEWKRHGRRSA